MVLIGLTGGIGSGKSTVAAMLAGRGAVVIDADQIAREVAAPGGVSYQALIDHFGAGIVRADGTLDRGAIATRVFSQPDELAALNAITHPAIAGVVAARIAAHAGTNRVLVLDIPLLGSESRGRYGLAGVIVVDTPVELAVARLVEQRGVSDSDARARVKAQIGRQERRRLADVVIVNEGSLEALETAVAKAWAWIETLGGAAGPR